MAEIIPGTQKFHTLDKDNVTKDLGSKQLQGMREIYTMDDITATAVGSIGVPTDLQYNTVALMQAATPDVGKYATTLGYTTPGDGGGALYLISSSGTADGGSVVALDNGTYAIAQLNGILDPVQWGAVLNDASSATVNVTAMNAMFAYYSLHSTTSNSPFVCNFTSGQYYVDGTVFLPQPPASGVGGLGGFTFYFNNSTITPTAGTFTVLHRFLPSSYWTSPEDKVDASFAMYDLLIEGAGIASGGIGLHVECTYNSIFSNVDIKSFETGMRLDFCLQASITSSIYTGNQRSIYLSNGNGLGWTTSSATNQCNRTKLDSVKVNMPGPGTATEGFYAEHAGGLELQTCVFEGQVPTNASVYVNMEGTTVQDFFAHNIHIESVLNGATPAANAATFKFFSGSGSGGTVNISGVYPQSMGGGYDRVAVDASGFSGTINYSTSFQGTDMFSAPASNATKWNFGGYINPTIVNQETAATYWVGGDQPDNMAYVADGRGTGNPQSIYASSSWGASGNSAFISGRSSAGVEGGKVRCTWNQVLMTAPDDVILSPGDDVQINLAATTSQIKITNVTDTIDTRISSPPAGSGQVILHLPTADGSYITGLTAGSAPSGAGDTGRKGDIRTDATYIYICTDTDTWIRSAITAW